MIKKIKKINFAKHAIICAFCLFLNVVFFSKLALCQISPITSDSRIKTLVYNPNEVYELKFYYGYQSFIEFAEDEEIEMISIGEAFAWRLTPAGKRLFIRPLEIAGHTNMTIITNKRTYHFDIRSGEYQAKADEELVYTVRFFYPQIGQPLPIPPQLTAPNPGATPQGQFKSPAPRLIVRTPIPPARVDEKLPIEIARVPEPTAVNLDFSLAGKADNITPLKVYDDGKKTYFQFANDNLIVPSINIVDVHGSERPLTYAIKDNFVEVPAIGRQFTLRLEGNMICVYNNKLLRINK